MKIQTHGGAVLRINERDLLKSHVGMSHAFATDIARRMVARLGIGLRVVPNDSRTGWCIRPHTQENA